MDDSHFFSDGVAYMEGNATPEPAYDGGDTDVNTRRPGIPLFDDHPGTGLLSPPSRTSSISASGAASQFQQTQLATPYHENVLGARRLTPVISGHRFGVSQPLTPDSRSSSMLTRTRSDSTTMNQESKSASTSVAPPTSQPLPPPAPPLEEEPVEPLPKKRRTRKARNSSSEEQVDKREKFLERNRVAASKCRQKKKEYVSELEDAKLGLETQRTQLRMERDLLLNEAERIKNQLMLHANCRDPNIETWIRNEARRFVHSSTERAQQAFLPPPLPASSHTSGTQSQPSHGRHLSTGSSGLGYPELSELASQDASLRRQSMTYACVFPAPKDHFSLEAWQTLTRELATSLEQSPLDPTFSNLTSPTSQHADLDYNAISGGIFDMALRQSQQQEQERQEEFQLHQGQNYPYPPQ